MKTYKICLLLTLFSFFVSCKKEEGKGGKLSIKGSVTARYFSDNISRFTGQYPGADLDVYLVYGDNIGYGDRTRTDFKGDFEFPYLRSGNYKVYVYSKDTSGTSPSEDLTIVQNVNLVSNTTLPTFTVALEDKRKPAEGQYSVSGKILGNFYKFDYTLKTGSAYLIDKDVYLIREGNPLLVEKEVTMPDGSFVFSGLAAGNYTLYTVSKDTTRTIASQELAVEVKVSITNSNIDVGTIIVAQEDKREPEIGPHKISGTVSVMFCDNDFNDCRGPFPSPDFDVFIMRENEEVYFEKVSSSDKGKYEIPELPNGKYTVYVITKNELSLFDPNLPVLLTVKKEVVIDNASVSGIDFELID